METDNQTTESPVEVPAPSVVGLGELPGSAIPFNEEVKWILGQPCFMVRNIARKLESLGLYTKENKAEAEQAKVLHWELSLYLKHGDKWREEGEKILRSVPNTDSATPVRISNQE